MCPHDRGFRGTDCDDAVLTAIQPPSGPTSGNTECGLQGFFHTLAAKLVGVAHIEVQDVDGIQIVQPESATEQLTSFTMPELNPLVSNTTCSIVISICFSPLSAFLSHLP